MLPVIATKGTHKLTYNDYRRHGTLRHVLLIFLISPLAPTLPHPLPRATMTMPEKEENLFANPMAEFPAITGSPTDNNIKKIREVLTNLL